jgi:hypothetical protein
MSVYVCRYVCALHGCLTKQYESQRHRDSNRIDRETVESREEAEGQSDRRTSTDKGVHVSIRYGQWQGENEGTLLA